VAKYENGVPRQSRRERSRQARAYVDTSKKEVIPYAGGKTTVLTGGVMLGDGPKRVVHCPEPWTTSM
jgi:protein Tob/BTG